MNDVETIGVVDTSKADAIVELARLVLPALRAVAKEKGYALATHGSMARDIDLIAVPWRPYDVAPAFELVEAIRAEAERVTGHTTVWFNDERANPSDYTRRQPEPKPHGRLGWSIHITGTRCYLDLSVMPTTDIKSDWTTVWRLFNRVWKHAAEFSIPLGYVKSDYLELQAQLHDVERAGDHRPPRVVHVRQEDASGCMVACLAMVTGESYTEIRQYFIDNGRTFEGDGAGITEFDAEFYLSDHGFAIARKYRWRWANVQRAEWPTPAFAPVHILGVRGAGSHGVVLLSDGTVLDPLIDAPRTLTDYPEVAYMMGIFKVARS